MNITRDSGTYPISVNPLTKMPATCVTWTEDISLGLRALTKAQNIVALKQQKMLTHIQTQWAYLISSLQCFIENRAATDYMYGPMEGVGGNINKRIPKWIYW